jgi:hypothetical protein
MNDFTSYTGVLTQGLIVVIILGMFYNLWNSTRIYGGLIGKAIRLLGLGTVFITLSIIEHLLVTFTVVENTTTIAIAQEIMNLFGIAFLGLGFSKLVSATKS